MVLSLNKPTIGSPDWGVPVNQNWTAIEDAINALAPALVPVGSILPYGGSTIPTGFLLCNSGAISRTTYADLFAVIGTTYGAGDGSTTFNLPNLDNAKIFKTSSTTLNVRGNGKSLGLTDGSSNAALGTVNNQGNLCATSSGYGKNVGTASTASGFLAVNKYYGVTTNAANSGIIVDLPSSVSFLWLIKY